MTSSSSALVGDPAALGFDPASLDRITRRVVSDIEQEKYDGARVIVARRGVPVLDLTAGFADRAAARPLRNDALFSVMSISKTFTAVALLQRVERGEVSLLTPVSKVIPEFAARGKERVTLAQVLTHTAGLGMGYAPVPTEELGNLEKVVAAICDLPLESAAGEGVAYSASTGFTILGEVVRRLDAKKRSYREIMKQEVFEPLRMKDTSVGLGPAANDRRVPVVVRDPDAPELNRKVQAARDQSVTEATEMPSGGGTFSSASDILRFGEALRCGGGLDGARVLSPAMVHLMTRNHTGLMPNSMMNSSRTLHGLAAFPAFLGLGIFLRGTGIFPSHIPSLASSETFGGWGLGSTAFWCDPEREITFVALTGGLMERIRSLVRFQNLGDMALAALVKP